jgi:hypothetical protein
MEAYFVFVNPRAMLVFFVNCGLPGEVFPDWATYNDSTTLCQELWGVSSSDPHTFKNGFNKGEVCKLFQ